LDVNQSSNTIHLRRFEFSTTLIYINSFEHIASIHFLLEKDSIVDVMLVSPSSLTNLDIVSKEVEIKSTNITGNATICFKVDSTEEVYILQNRNSNSNLYETVDSNLTKDSNNFICGRKLNPVGSFVIARALISNSTNGTNSNSTISGSSSSFFGENPTTEDRIIFGIIVGIVCLFILLAVCFGIIMRRKDYTDSNAYFFKDYEE